MIDLDYLTMNQKKIFLNLKYNLDWIEDIDMSNLLYDTFLLEECVYHDPDLMAHQLQAKANLIADRYNALYKTTMIKYDPLYNFHMIETGKSASQGTSTSEASGNSLASEFPMDEPDARPVGKGENKSNGKASSSGEVSQQLEKKGQIGFSAQDLIEKERKLIINLKERYVREFNDYFMITI